MKYKALNVRFEVEESMSRDELERIVKEVVKKEKRIETYWMLVD